MRLPVPADIPAAEQLGRVHFVGIGGAGLSAIARVMLARGVVVSGSDGTDSAVLAALRGFGATCWVGHDATHLDALEAGDTVVVSTAVREDNPEVLEARRRGLRLWPRSAGLASVLAGRRAVCVAGTHGKSTTTSLLSLALQAAGADPSYAIGANLAATGVNADAGAGELFVAEADESDGAFLVYEPFAAVVTNVEADHLDVWGTPEAYAAAFEEFADHVADDGFLVVCVDDPGAARLAQRQRAAGRRVVTVSARRPDSDDGADVDLGPDALDGVVLWSPGEHYLADALAALATGLALGFEHAALVRGLTAYTGSERRMELRGAVGEGPAAVRVYDSYAHHPTEIAGDLATARALAGSGRVVVAYQPHLVSRTRLMGAQMGQALGAADEVIVTDVYLAREDADPAVTGALVAAAVPLPPDRVHDVPDLDDVAPSLAALARPGDLLLTLGAGTITRCAAETLHLLATRPSSAGGRRPGDHQPGGVLRG